MLERTWLSVFVLWWEFIVRIRSVAVSDYPAFVTIGELPDVFNGHCPEIAIYAASCCCSSSTLRSCVDICNTNTIVTAVQSLDVSLADWAVETVGCSISVSELEDSRGLFSENSKSKSVDFLPGVSTYLPAAPTATRFRTFNYRCTTELHKRKARTRTQTHSVRSWHVLRGYSRL